MSALPALWAAGTSLAAPVLRLLLARRARRGKEIAARLPERRGIERAPRPEGRLLWLHAASVGETVSILPVLGELAARAPALTVLLTTGTVTSARLLEARLPALGLEGRVLHRFAPLDVPRWVARFLDHWRPDAAGFVESELWPNIFAACRRRSMPILLVNARLSPRSAAGWRRAPGFARALFAGLAGVRAQSAADAGRFAALGAPEVSAPGNLKFVAPALPADAAELRRLRALLGERPAWLAASTHPGEEAIAIAVHRRLAARFPGLLTVIAPRHPERGPEIAPLAAGFAVARRAAGEDPPPGGVWIADTLGELGLLYRLVPTVFVGRSLLPPGGGQNPLEPARLSCAVAAGTLTGNFDEPVAALRAAGALAVVADEAALADWVAAMLDDPAARGRAGAAGAAAAAAGAGLAGETAEALLGLMRRRG